jgi:hypothetical protein
MLLIVIGNTMNDFIAFLEKSSAWTTSLGGGVEINADGEVVITGNTGSEQDLDISCREHRRLIPTARVTQPFVLAKGQFRRRGVRPNQLHRLSTRSARRSPST